MFWITADPLIAGHLQEYVVTGRVAPRLANPLTNAVQKAPLDRPIPLGLGLTGVHVGKLTIDWEQLSDYDPVRQRWIGALPITYLALARNGKTFRQVVIALPGLRLRRLNELVLALRSRQITPDALAEPTGHWPDSRPVKPGRAERVLYFVDGASGGVSTVPTEQVPSKHWWPGATTGWRDYRLPKIATGAS